jgi:hypothetical protein
MSEQQPPRGSGYYAVIIGVLFILACVGSSPSVIAKVTPGLLMRAWLVFVSATLILWGSNRIRRGRKDWTVGQDTITLVNGLITSTIALFALLFRP